ncbi:tigger transposable element-derived protein 1 [Trichonephila clavipes]|nr:tigger transposable element-derived protein 1 [Trichonephila clavipes]
MQQCNTRFGRTPYKLLKIDLNWFAHPLKGTGESTVRAIKKNEAAIRKSIISGTKLSTKFASYTRDVLLERTERAIAIWIEEQVQRRIPCATADERAAKIFPEELAKIIEDGDYSADQVFNADETGLYWKKMSNRTYIAKDEKTASGHKVKIESPYYFVAMHQEIGC